MKTKLLPACLLPAPFAMLNARTWTSTTGPTAEAGFVKVEGGNVIVRAPHGRTLPFPIARLSSADQAFIKQQTGVAPEAASKLQTNTQAGQFLMVLEKK